MGNQARTLAAIGLFTGLLGPENQWPRLSDPAGADPIAARARSYLHSNCAMCHRPNAPVQGNQDFRYATPFAMA